jgi:hypothetical protein
MNEWEARYKALAAGITDEQLIANAEKIVSQALLLSQGSTLPFERVFNAMLHTVHVLREKPKYGDGPADNVKHLGMTENGTQYTP